jgi:hypothetical protein
MAGSLAIEQPRVGSVRLGRLIAYSWLLAGAAIAALQVVHQDVHEHAELPAPVHWLRDGSLAVPAAAIAVLLATLLLARFDATARIGLAWAAVAAVAFAVLSIPGNQLHAVLFGAEEESVGWLEDVLLDGAVTLGAALALLVPLALALGTPWHRAAPAADDPIGRSR